MCQRLQTLICYNFNSLCLILYNTIFTIEEWNWLAVRVYSKYAYSWHACFTIYLKRSSFISMVLIFNTINFYINWLTVTKLGQATVAVAKEMAPHIRKHGQKLLPDSIKSKTPAPGSNSKVDKVVDGAVEVAASGLKGKWLKSIISTSDFMWDQNLCVLYLYLYIFCGLIQILVLAEFLWHSPTNKLFFSSKNYQYDMIYLLFFIQYH